jgi:beta propeller domain-containing protein
MSLGRTVTRSLVTLGALTGLGAAFVAGTSYDGSGPGHLDPWRDGGGTGGSDASPAAYSGSDLSLADSCDELLQWYVERGVERVGPYGWDGYRYDDLYKGGVVEDAAPLSASGSAADQATRGNVAAEAPLPATVRSTNGETGTNVQESGVDEPDTVKTDGRTLFRVEGSDLVTYDVSGDEVRRLGSADLPGLHDAELLLSGDTVVAIAQDGEATTGLVTLDVSDPAAPTVTHTVEYGTTLVAARLHDGVVRVVLQAALPDLDFVLPNKTTTEWEATHANQDLVRESSVEDWLPTVSTDDGPAERLLDCDEVAIPDDGTTLGTLAVVGFDASAPQAPSVSGLAVDTDLAYASADQLYLATSPWSGTPGCFDCLEPQSDFPVPGWLPGGSVSSAEPGDDGTSHLYAFDLDGIDTVFAASGEVDGVIRDRWAMDAYDGVLRVAVGPTVRTGSFNSVVTFRQEANDLVETGRLDELGVGEDIESVRWFDTLAIVVTFRQVDPLYAIDLTDAASPRLMGELKIPGFSAYLHPLGQHRLLGLGEGPADNGQWGAQAGLFNVTDLTNPTQLDVLSYGPGTQALATQDPRQLTWLPDGRTVLSVVVDWGKAGQTGYVSVLTLGDGELANRMVPVEYGGEVTDVRLVPLPDGRVVLVTGDDASFFAL